MSYKISLKNIKSYRKLKGYSQLRLAEEIGTSVSTISRLENDREKAPSPFDLMELYEK